jgi:DNA-binding NarL/FixJ family response regulator
MILYCCSDLIFATKIRSTGEALGVPTQSIPQDTNLAALKPDQGGGARQDPDALMVDLELADGALRLIEQAGDVLPNTEVVAFGAHVDKAILDAAKAHGAERVMPRSTFTEKLPELLRKHQAA